MRQLQAVGTDNTFSADHTFLAAKNVNDPEAKQVFDAVSGDLQVLSLALS